MKKAVLFLAPGFEEIEALATVDILRRGGIEVTTVSISSDPFVCGVHGIEVTTDAVDEYPIDSQDAVILPGGMPGAENLSKSSIVIQTIKKFYQENKIVAAICAAPFVLGKADILKGKNVTCYPGFQDKLNGATYLDKRVVTDNNIITACGPSATIEFALELLKKLTDSVTADSVAKAMLIK